MLQRGWTQRIWIVVSLVVILSLAACGAKPTAGPATEVAAAAPTAAPLEPTAPASPAESAAGLRYVETLRLPGGGYWGHPSPFGFNRGPGFVRTSLVFDTLVWRDASGETIPWLATDWSLSDDELTWTFTLRDGVQWQDGEPLTVDDVVIRYEGESVIGLTILNASKR